MGIVSVEAEVSTGGTTRERVIFMVDSGAVYSVLPQNVWRALGLTPTRRLSHA